MFCKFCGKPCDDGTKFCPSCGANLTEAPASARAAAPVAAPAGDIVATVKKYLAFILAGVAVLALIFSILNIFSTYEVTAIAKLGDESMESSGPIAELFDEAADGKFTMALIGNLIFGFANLAIAAVAGLFFAEKQFGVNIYGQFIAPIIKANEPTFLIGAVGAGTALFQIIAYALCTQTEKVFGQTVSMSICNHWTTWVALVIFAGLAVADKLLLNKKAAQ